MRTLDKLCINKHTRFTEQTDRAHTDLSQYRLLWRKFMEYSFYITITTIIVVTVLHFLDKSFKIL